MHPVFVQAIAYSVVMIISMLLLSFLFRGFFWKFIKVKMSFGKLVLVKSKAKLRHHYTIAKEEDGFLVFKIYKEVRRVNIPKQPVFYRSIGITWADYDEEKGILISVDLSKIEGLDPSRYNDLYIRALYKPSIVDNKTKVILVLLVVIALLVIGSLIFDFQIYKLIKGLSGQIGNLQVGTVTPAKI